MAFGSSNNYGPGCGKCFKLTLLNSYTGTPPFFPDKHPSIVVKVTDLCPLSENGWCSGTENKKNLCVLVRCVVIPFISPPPPFVLCTRYRLRLKYVRKADARCGYRGGQYLNFDLAYPSSAIPDDFFPSNEKLYGYKARVLHSHSPPPTHT